MAEITAAAVKDLRERTGAGMMDAKNALVETKGDVEAAVDLLRKKGLAKAAKKSGRTAAEGLVAVAMNADGTEGAVLEVNSETDFVARNDKFQTFALKAVQAAVAGARDIDALAKAPYGTGKSVQETLTEMIATIGENMGLRRMACQKVSTGQVCAYVHNAVSPNLGKIGVLVALESTGDKAKLQVLGKQIAMHVAATNPESLDVTSLDPALIEREKAVLRDQAAQSGKPADIIEKMLEGRIRKFYEEVVLMEQTFIMDSETKISKVLENAAKDMGAPVKLVGFTRFMLGDGIEKEETDFAAEVAKVVNG